MKKFLSLILALAMIACMSVTAFADNGPSGTTTLTTTKENTPKYTLNIPSDQTIPYGATETNIGKVTVSDVDPSVYAVDADCAWTDFSDGDGNSIPLTIVFDSYLNGGKIHDHVDPEMYAEYIYRSGQDRYCEYFVQIAPEDWAAAVPGTYTAIITFVSTYNFY